SWTAGATRDGIAAGLDEATAATAARRFGTRVGRLHSIVAGEPALAARIHPDLPFALAEVLFAARHEMACTLEDILRRRIPLMLLARYDEASLARAASVAAREPGWNERRLEEEIRTARARWSPAGH